MPESQYSTPDCSLKFSIIMPVYNVESYLAEAVDSVINQTLPFVENTEIILINDGSPDGSHDICTAYQQRFPDNIRYYQQENRGVSATRNRGISMARGKHLGFLDPDDLYAEDTLKSVLEFFESRHDDGVELATVPIHFFGAREGEHLLNSKFRKGSRVIDVSKEWSLIQGSLSSSFVERKAFVYSQIHLDSRLKYAEDMKAVTQFIMRTGKYGVVDKGGYLYRKREGGGSALDQNVNVPDWYSPVLEYFAFSLFNQYAYSESGKIPRYVQMVVAYDLQWRLKQAKQSVLLDWQEDDYKRRLKRLIEHLDDSVIMRLEHVNIEHKLYMFSIKYGEDPMSSMDLRNQRFYYRGFCVWAPGPTNFKCHVSSIDIRDGKLELKGFNKGLPLNGIQFGFILNGEFVKSIRTETPQYKTVKFLGEPLFKPPYFVIKIPVGPDTRITPAVKYGGHIYATEFVFTKNAKMTNSRTAYREFGDWFVQNVENRQLAVKPVSKRALMRRELSFAKDIATGPYKGIQRRKLLLLWYRILALGIRLSKKRQWWIISDRFSSAGDNGEAFFRYLNQNKSRNEKIFFLHSRADAAFHELSEVGRVVDPSTFWGRVLFLVADVFASSQADDYVLNPFGKDHKIMGGSYRYRFVFLGHGVNIQNLSGWLNCYDKTIDQFITVGDREYRSIVDGEYGFGEGRVALTGLPRYDRLSFAHDKTVIIAPTWRKHLAGSVDKETKKRVYNTEFRNSEYFAFYQQLIENERLNRVLKKTGFKLKLVLHPNHAVQAGDFRSSPQVSVLKPPFDYKDLISKATVFVTDYSSVAVDAAYLRKFVVYSQFDYDTFFKNHTYTKGYFDYMEDGFGPVCTSVESTVDAIIAGIESNGVPRGEYLSRMDEFFAFKDKNNSARVEREIKKLLEQ
ncbi:glycosyltransferase [uncultured Corynebacterium sp.]|uniref:bifunctional glycosyltransferase/CDP-glycerol:glycerophosphate glycerophosphotransferase n=1 Tax=uncultured Corynebacterium sp. TaxID=159447 RepID=UPI00288C1BCE|nr:glycosyltransferase [uncultured Corynebacterium sp.]